MKRRNSLFMLLLFSLTLLSGCGQPKEDAQSTLQKYCDAIQSGQYAVAYEMLSKTEKKKVTSEEYILAYELEQDIDADKSYTIDYISKMSDKTLNDTTYSEAYRYEVQISEHNFARDKVEIESSYYYVVDESSKWAVIADSKISIREKIAALYNEIASNHLMGRGKQAIADEGMNREEIQNKAIEALKNALNYDTKNNKVYYNLASVLIEQGNFKDALQYAKSASECANNNKEKADALNLLGVTYENTGNLVQAKAVWQDAFNLDPDNTYVLDNLERVKK